MFEILQYSFIVRGLEAGIIIALVSPLIGIFLVLRRYSLIADTLAHVSLAGVAIGLLLGVNPVVTAILASAISSVGIEKLRLTKKVYGESALAIFLSGSLAIAVVLIGLAHGFNVDLFSYLFGSIVTVNQTDLYTIAGVAVFVALILYLFFKELIYTTFDEEAAKVSGIPTKLVNYILVLLSALVISLSIPIIGVLLISALIVFPVITALQFKMNFKRTLLIAEVISVFSVISGIFISYYLNLATGGVIVLINLLLFVISLFLKRN